VVLVRLSVGTGAENTPRGTIDAGVPPAVAESINDATEYFAPSEASMDDAPKLTGVMTVGI
jgi:hypothetical protein